MGHNFLRVTQVRLHTDIHQPLQAWSNTGLLSVLCCFAGSSTLTGVCPHWCARGTRRGREQHLPRKGSLVSMPLRTVPGPYLAPSGSQGASTLSPGSKECFIPFTHSRMSPCAVFCTHTGCLPRDTSGLANSTRNMPLSLC